MIKISRALFDTIVKTSEMTQDILNQCQIYLDALYQIYYLTDKEVSSVLNVLSYMKQREDLMMFKDMIAAIETKFSFPNDLPFDVDLPSNYQFSVDGETLSLDDIRKRNIQHVDMTITKPIRNSTQYRVNHRINRDGSIENISIYNVYDAPPIGEDHAFNVYGEKCLRHPTVKE